MDRVFRCRYRRHSCSRNYALLALTWVVLGGTACSELPEIVILAPLHGEFTQAATVDASGLPTAMSNALRHKVF